MTEYKEYEELLEKVDELVREEANYQDKVSALGEIACHCIRRMAHAYHSADKNAKREADMFLGHAVELIDDMTTVVREYMDDVNSDIEERYDLMFERRN